MQDSQLLNEHVVKGEIHNVLSVMRQNSRYASRDRFKREVVRSTAAAPSASGGSSSSASDDYTVHPLVRKFEDLSAFITRRRHSLNLASRRGPFAGSPSASPSAASPCDVDCSIYVPPFAACITSPDTSGAITGAALSSLHKFLLYNVISSSSAVVAPSSSVPSPSPSPPSSSASVAAHLIADALTHCRFEETSVSVDSVVVMKLLELTALLVRHEVGALLSEDAVFDLFVTVLSISGALPPDGAVSAPPSSSHPSPLPRSSSTRSTDRPQVVASSSSSLRSPAAPGGEHSELLRRAAGETAAHIVLVLFGRAVGRAESGAFEHGKNGAASAKVEKAEHFDDGGGRRKERNEKDEYGDNEDDDWGMGDSPEDEKRGNTHSADPPFSTTSSGTSEEVVSTTVSSSSSFSTAQPHPLSSLSATPGSPSSSSTALPIQFDPRVPSPTPTPPVPSQSSTTATEHTSTTTTPTHGSPAIVRIVDLLSRLLDPRVNPDDTIILSLSLINIALETAGTSLNLYPALIPIMQGELCKHLLQNSCTEDLGILSLTLRVVFNLFNSIKGHLKIQLEVFLTSIHLRILEGTFSPEQRELALESLLEFCQEPALMLDLYTNYDCDLSCTNLFETIAKALGRYASGGGTHTTHKKLGELNVLNRLAIQGILAVLDAIYNRCPILKTGREYQQRQMMRKQQQEQQEQLLRIEEERKLSGPPPSLERTATGDSLNDDGGVSDCDSETARSSTGALPAESRESTAQLLKERKRRKHLLQLAADRFNQDDKGWIKYCQEVKLLPPQGVLTAEHVAAFLYETPSIDKTKVGIYLSKGPVDKYPFNAFVLSHYVALFDFSNLSFSESLRAFLLRFRLPGEAQCIDRLMEAFATHLYKQLQEKPESCNPFKNSDAAFVLSFSTIMLNTDLHNPQIAEDKRMTLEQFVRNNRGVNGGEDLPRDFLVDLYHQIKTEEIQVQQEIKNVINDINQWDGLLSQNSTAFTTTDAVTSDGVTAGVHEKDMFRSIAEVALASVAAVFERSRDDEVVTNALVGFQQYARICVYFDMAEEFNHLIVLLLRYGLEYVSERVCLDSKFRGDALLQSLLVGGKKDSEGQQQQHQQRDGLEGYDSFVVLSGIAEHRGLIALQCALVLIRSYTGWVRNGWVNLMEVLFALRSVNSLPDALNQLDDLADSSGQTLPNSPFAERCVSRADEFSRNSQLQSKNAKSGGGFWGSVTSLFSSNSAWEEDTTIDDEVEEVLFGKRGDKINERLTASEATKVIVARAQLDLAFVGSKDLALDSLVIMLKSILTSRSPNAGASVESPAFELQAVLSLELGSKVVLCNRRRAGDVWRLLHDYIQRSLVATSLPYLMERAMVTVLRSFIHLFDTDNPSLRSQLLDSLALLKGIPPNVLRHLSDRVGSGLAIIIRTCANKLSGPTEWGIICDLLDATASYVGGRHYVFECIVHTVKDGLIQQEGDAHSTIDGECLGPVCAVLLKFVNGAYEGDMKWSCDAMGHLSEIVRWSYNEGGSHPVHDGVLVAILESLHAQSFSRDADICKVASDQTTKVLASTKVELIGYAAWMRIFDSVLLKPTPLLAPEVLGPKAPAVVVAKSKQLTQLNESSRLRSCENLSRALLRTLPYLGSLGVPSAGVDLQSVLQSTARIMAENVKMRAPTTLFFESATQLCTNMANVFALDEFNDDSTIGVKLGELGTRILLDQLAGIVGAAERVEEILSARIRKASESHDCGEIQKTEEAEAVASVSPTKVTGAVEMMTAVVVPSPDVEPPAETSQQHHSVAEGAIATVSAVPKQPVNLFFLPPPPLSTNIASSSNV